MVNAFRPSPSTSELMKLPLLLSAALVLALTILRTPGNEVVLVNWNQTWDYMQPMGVDPVLADPDFNSTWFQKPADFAANYNGPAFGGATSAGSASNTTSINHGSGPGPLGYDIIDYFSITGAEMSERDICV